MDYDRKAFEAWAITQVNLRTFTLQGDGDQYANTYANLAWKAWKAGVDFQLARNGVK